MSQQRARLRGPAAMPLAERSWWLREALAADPGAPCPPLRGATRADVAIVGGGYTGLWTALQLKRADPGADVVVLESDICGAGPSGRNGGFLYGLWEDFEVLVELFGSEGAVRVGEAAERAVDAAEAAFREAGIDVWLRRAGHLTVSTSPVFDAALDAHAALCRRPGFPAHQFQRLSADEVAARCRSPHFRGGILHTRGATVQPARVARGLRALALARGVRIHEATPVETIEGGAPVQIATREGEVRAEQLVLGINAWSNQLPGFRRRIFPRASHIVLTEPAPDALHELGWTGGEAIGDFRATVHYLRTTPDGRIAFGAGTGSSAGRVGSRMARDPGWERRLAATLRRWFPPFRDVAIEASWGGPIDVGAHHVPFFGSIWGGNVHYGMGFTGGGVGH